MSRGPITNQDTIIRRRSAMRSVAARRGQCPSCGRGGTWRVGRRYYDDGATVIPTHCRYCGWEVGQPKRLDENRDSRQGRP